jgi:hypothetical protein
VAGVLPALWWSGAIKGAAISIMTTPAKNDAASGHPLEPLFRVLTILFGCVVRVIVISLFLIGLRLVKVDYTIQAGGQGSFYNQYRTYRRFHFKVEFVVRPQLLIGGNVSAYRRQVHGNHE